MNQPKIVEGTKVTFKDNQHQFFQDFRLWKGIPAGIEFTVVKEAKANSYWLVAKGYGDPEDYGNGPIAVPTADILEAM